ncbi:LysM peptidoglycan-binding domain-containing protein [Aldersonia kunmingensis]|uniref:LysM peptidoglycan-binding domain-containing protein n=1 Tax=Aldersonia kunmingensis TaxID=408066 RepID=UPI00082A1926|nr:LysM peptidoglycan-binding domain-containing protein [Aldersonia kunmingensis]
MSKKYKVVSGDTLSGLANRFYGDGSLFMVIAIPNDILNPDFIRVGQVLLIPGLSQKYRVTVGDTLSSVAEQFYGDCSMDALIAAANHLSVNDDLSFGQVLRIPDL